MQARGGRKKRGETQCLPACVVCRDTIMVLLVILNLNDLCKLPQQGFGSIKEQQSRLQGVTGAQCRLIVRRNTPSTSRLHFLLHLPGSACTSATGSPTCQVCSSRAHIPQRGRRRPSSQRVIYGGNEEITQTDFFFFYFNYKLLYSSNYLINVQKMNLTYLGSCFSKFE